MVLKKQVRKRCDDRTHTSLAHPYLLQALLHRLNSSAVCWSKMSKQHDIQMVLSEDPNTTCVDSTKSNQVRYTLGWIPLTFGSSTLQVSTVEGETALILFEGMCEERSYYNHLTRLLFRNVNRSMGLSTEGFGIKRRKFIVFN